MATTSQTLTQLRYPPGLKIILEGGQTKVKSEENTVEWQDIDDILSSTNEPISVDVHAENPSLVAEFQPSLDAMDSTIPGVAGNPIAIESDNSDSAADDSDQDECDHAGTRYHDSGSHCSDNHDQDLESLPSISDLLERSRGNDTADQSQQTNDVPRNSPTPLNDHNADTAMTQVESNEADSGSQRDFNEADGARGKKSRKRDRESPRSHSTRDYDKDEYAEDDNQSHSPGVSRASSPPSKRQKVVHVASHVSSTDGNHQFDAWDIRQIGDGTNTTTTDTGMVDNSRDGRDTTSPLDGVENQQDASLRHQSSPPSGSFETQDVRTIRDGSVVSVDQTSDPNDNNAIGHAGQELRRLQEATEPRTARKDYRFSPPRRRGRRRRGIRRTAREEEECQRTSRPIKQDYTTRSNDFNDSSDDFESESRMSLRSSQRSQRRRLDALASQDRGVHHAAERKLPKRPHRYSTDPDPATLQLEVSNDRETQLDDSNGHPQTAPTRVAHVTIRPYPRDVSVLFAYGRGRAVQMRYDGGLPSAIEDIVGHAVKLANILIESLTPRSWLLTGLVLGPDDNGGVQIAEGQSTAQATQSAENVSQSASRPRRRSRSSAVRFGDESQQSDIGDDGDASNASSDQDESSQEHVEHDDSGEESDELDGSSG